MKIQKPIAAMMNKISKTSRSQKELAGALGAALPKGKENPRASTIETLAKGLNMTPSQIISGEGTSEVFALLGDLVDCLHPATQRSARLLLEDLRQLFRESEELYAQRACWRYAVTEPRPSHYALKVAERTGRGWLITPMESEPFTNDRTVAESAAELFTRCALSPIHLDEAIKDFMSTH